VRFSIQILARPDPAGENATRDGELLLPGAAPALAEPAIAGAAKTVPPITSGCSPSSSQLRPLYALSDATATGDRCRRSTLREPAGL